MFGKKDREMTPEQAEAVRNRTMTPAQAKAALKAAAAESAARAADPYLRCRAGHIIYAGTRGGYCSSPGCRA